MLCHIGDKFFDRFFFTLDLGNGLTPGCRLLVNFRSGEHALGAFERLLIFSKNHGYLSPFLTDDSVFSFTASLYNEAH